MENDSSQLKSSIINKRLNSTTIQQGKQNLIKKRPSTTKLDLQKIFQQSIELTEVFKKLTCQNTQLRLQHQKVQSAKCSRQALISMVETIVKEKAKQLNKNPTNQSSWLVHKLNSKVYQLKNKIQAKEKAIRQVDMSKESEWIREKECEMKCLDEVISHMRAGKPQAYKSRFGKQSNSDEVREQDDNNTHDAENTTFVNGIKQVVWLEQEIRQKQDQILQAERIFQQEQRQVRKLMMQIAKRKAQLSQIKQLQQEFHRAQQEFKQEKKKKQQRLAGNKTYLDELIQSRHTELKKLQNLKQKYHLIEAEETENVKQLECKLAKLKREYQEKNKARQELVFKVVEDPVSQSKEKWVKRVTFKEVCPIASNLNYFIALKRVSKEQALKTILKENEQQLSIREVIRILQQYPFQISNYQQRQLLARYCIEDAGQGYFMQDMQTSQAIPIIKSVLSKLIGDVRVYSQQEQQRMMQKTGDLMHKFHSLVQQNLQSKQGSSKKKFTKEQMEDAINAIELDLSNDEVNFIVLYLFSWINNIDKLETGLLANMQEKGVKWLKGKKGQKTSKVIEGNSKDIKEQEVSREV